MLKQLLVFLAIYVACSIAKEFHIPSPQVKKELTKMGMEKKYVDEVAAMNDEFEKGYAALAKDPVGLKKAEDANMEKTRAFMKKLPTRQYTILNDWFDIHDSESN
ncbi:hypothetical protein CRE_07085 [Caenorhabditis remanei]|uniref:Uncharacterized protein n=1 Tax=Caenorhabditis remanei TaxID=31234 RepID=E3NKQ2_CAERE|nr:hypothetical protein CRE_07085 [Caenorhabditis remanei]